MIGRVLVSLAVASLAAGCSGSAGLTPAPSPTLESTPTATTTARPAPTPTLTPGIGLPADDGARIVAVESPTTLQHRAWVEPGSAGCPASANPGCWVAVGSPVPTFRARDLTIDSPAVGLVHVRLLLPKHFTAQPSTRWPVLVLHHGGTGHYSDWTEALDAQTLTGPTDVLVVMPDGDPGWETFHVVELRQLLERNWQAGDKWAVAGLSMGGAEAMAEAEGAPGMFVFAGSYSGPLDPSADLSALKGTALYVAYATASWDRSTTGRSRPTTRRAHRSTTAVPPARPSSRGSPS
jgi:Putative esterase